ncbi:hypothetical protein THAOC_26528 [Thalassiosira oceanica]|uniref:Uncharacterized protein n=1 Tax=Thalassiosira oceanica TaxID=159749 RepID=K0RJQ2_THAOC|nr:hypothetical protein THAOC_26528 [Thalassiosira oceanica]|eukprot:EJK53938.1 hypothetical protein THAOC_26528 [Thalassiosira oceanica]
MELCSSSYIHVALAEANRRLVIQSNPNVPGCLNPVTKPKSQHEIRNQVVTTKLGWTLVPRMFSHCLYLGIEKATAQIVQRLVYSLLRPLRLPREKSSAATPGEDCSPPLVRFKLTGCGGNWSLAASPRPHNIDQKLAGSQYRQQRSVSSPQCSVANRKQSNLFVCVILRWVPPLTRTVPLNSPG